MNGFARHIAVLAGALTLFLVTPALASASQSFLVSSPTGFPANGDPSYTTTQVLDSGSMGAPGKVTITLAPGVLASLNANPSCVKTQQYTTACEIGTGSASTSIGVGLGLTAYLVPPPNTSTDAAGIDLLTGPPSNQTTHVAVDLVQTASGNVASVLKLDLSGLGPLGGVLTKMSLTVNGTLGGKPFTRMPSNCNVTTHSSLTVQYAKGTETSQASPDFVPTGCSALPFTPQVSASAVKDAHDDGVAVTTVQTQPLGQAAGLTTTLQLPWPAIGTNTSAVSLQNTTTAVGTAVATSPLQPAPLKGFAYLTGTGPFTPSLTLRFPPPVAITLVGTVNLSTHTVTFSNQPDVPQTSLVVTLFGGPKALELATCAPSNGILRASNTGQNGTVANANFPLHVTGCPSAAKPKGPPRLVSLSLGGLAAGRPSLSFSVAHGSNAPKLKTVRVSLPGGLSFATKRPIKGISVGGAHTLRIAGGKLTITLNRPASMVSVRIASAALVERKALQQHARKHKVTPGVRVAVTDGAGTRTSVNG
ncbi:MAG TPA: hypothetical protein VGF81_12565 [Solirubrobacteraceae bacterium]